MDAWNCADSTRNNKITRPIAQTNKQASKEQHNVCLFVAPQSTPAFAAAAVCVCVDRLHHPSSISLSCVFIQLRIDFTSFERHGGHHRHLHPSIRSFFRAGSQMAISQLNNAQQRDFWRMHCATSVVVSVVDFIHFPSSIFFSSFTPICSFIKGKFSAVAIL